MDIGGIPAVFDIWSGLFFNTYHLHMTKLFSAYERNKNDGQKRGADNKNGLLLNIYVHMCVSHICIYMPYI